MAKTTSNINAAMEFTHSLLQQGDAIIELNPHYRDVVLVLGNTGSGKSTLIQWLRGNSQLLSIEVAKGTGEYLITDNNNRIGNSTTTSQTLFPELILDGNSNYFYDCPGFQDTRNATYDIAASFFIRKVIKHAKSVKLLFVVSYPSVRKGVDRIDFPKFLTHATKLVQNIEKFKDSIAMVVTKVDNSYIRTGRDFTLVDDAVIIKNIADFLLEVQQDLENREVTSYNSIALIKILRTQVGNEYSRIGIFRRPDDGGFLNENKVLEDERESFLKTLESLSFTCKVRSDFGFTISAESRNEVNDLINKVSDSIVSDISNLRTAVESSFTKKEETLHRKTLLNEFKIVSKMLTDLQSSAEHDDLMNVIKQIMIVINKLDIAISAKLFTNLMNSISHMKFLSEVIEQSIPLHTKIWIKDLLLINKYFITSRNFYKFLDKLDEVLSNFKIRESIQKSIDVTSLISEIKEGSKIKGINVLNKMSKFSSVVQEEIQVEDLNGPKLQSLENLLNKVLIDDVVVNCEMPEKIIARGRFVKFSDVVQAVCIKEARIIEIFATLKVFVDASFVSDEEVQLSIIAPEWEIIGLQKIVLDGKNGKKHLLEKADDGSTPGSSGKPGLPGFPGGAAGNFYGIGSLFMNGLQLRVSANGGMGGPGQNGGNGAVGKNGTDAYPSSYRRKRGLMLGKHEDHRGYIAGEKGHRGGRGGNGGKGGIGGANGEIQILSLGKHQNHYINKSNNSGQSGSDGFGGVGGEGGISGKNCVVDYWSYRFFFLPVYLINNSNYNL